MTERPKADAAANLKRLLRAYKAAGKPGLRKLYQEMFPDETSSRPPANALSPKSKDR